MYISAEATATGMARPNPTIGQVDLLTAEDERRLAQLIEIGRQAAAAAAAAPPPPPPGEKETEDEAALRAVPSPLSAMPFGPQVGTFVHGVLEEADFAAADDPIDAWLAERPA